jgi:hypothetical protein
MSAIQQLVENLIEVSETLEFPRHWEIVNVNQLLVSVTDSVPVHYLKVCTVTSSKF